MSNIRVIKRTPDLGLRIRLQRVPDEVAPAPVASPMVTWAGFQGFPYGDAHAGADTSAPVVQWAEAVQYSPIAEIAVTVDVSGFSYVAHAVLFNPPAGATVSWSAEWVSQDLGYEPNLQPASGQMTSLYIPTFGWETSLSMRLIATVDGVTHALLIHVFLAEVGDP